jgi:hypothetical protein
MSMRQGEARSIVSLSLRARHKDSAAAGAVAFH